MAYRKPGRVPVLLAAAALLLAACGSVEASEPDEPTTGPARSAASSSAGRPTGQVSAAEQVDRVRLTVSGGIAGARRSIVASTDGSVEISDRRQGTREADPLSGAELDRLKSLLAEVDFAALPARSVDEGARDVFLYELRHDGHTVVTDRSVPLGAADDLIAQLERHLEERL
jgi:hypothetical protein